MRAEGISATRGDTLKAYALLLLASAGVAMMPATARLAYMAGSNVETVILIRSFTGALILGGWLTYSRSGFRIPSSHFLPAALASISAAGMNYTFYSAIRYMDIGMTTLIIFIHPLLVAFYFHSRGKTPLTLFRVVWGLAAFAGVGLALAVDFSNISNKGMYLAFASAMFATSMVLGMLALSEKVGGATTNFHLSLWTFLIFILIVLSVGEVQFPQTTLGWVSAFGNGISYITAYLTFLLAAALIGGSRVSMLSFMEPVAAILLAAALFDERMNTVQWMGVALVGFGICAMEAPSGTWRKLLGKSE